ncbi:MAG: translocation/assembly module TamB domain-containing protein, partial [Verrucomicrobiota bacterium]
LALTGPAGGLRVSGDAAGFAVDAEAFGTGWLRPWLTADVPAVSVERLGARGAWAAGPLVMSVRARARLPLGEAQTATVDLDASGGANGVWLKTLSVGTGGQPVASATGRLPLVIRPARAEPFEWLPEGGLALTAKTEPSAKFWDWLADLSGLALEHPSVDVDVAGTWRRPEGRANLTVARISADPQRWPWAVPELRDLNARLRGGADGLFLEALTVEVAGQRVLAEGGLKAAPDRWPALLAEPTRLAEAGGTLRLRIPDAEVAALARFMPQVLAPTGRLQLDLALREGGGWDGFLKLTDAASRPLGPLGVLGEVNADIRLRDRSVELANVSARIGGRPVVLAGSVDLSDWRSPAPDLTLQGQGLPLVRRSGVLVRSDLDLKATTDPATGRVTVGGAVRLRDSLLLADLRSLLPGPGGPRGPARRPPWFSVEVEPINAWGLDVALRGERFLRVRTPLFNGVVSARFRLGGTLGEPTLVGEAPVNEGVVKLPFASFTMEQGMFYISAADPGTPRLRLAATGRSYGYALRMELGGPASSPELTFSSTPPLSSEQVLLMVMAGETPSDEISFTAGQRAVRVGAYLGQSLLDTFGVPGGSSDRLTINVGQRISRQGRETYDVSYELTEDWSLVGEYSEFDDYNAGVKWRFYTSKPPEKTGEDDDER